MRFSVTTEVDGEKKAPYAWIGDVWIDVYAPDLPLRCWLRDVDDDFYESSSEGVTSYELQWYNDETGEYIGEKFVIEIEE